MAEIRIAVDPKLMPLAELQTQVERNLSEQGVPVTFTADHDSLRGLDPTILVGVVSALGTILTAVVGAVAHAGKGKGGGKIIVKGDGGAAVEVPADTPLDTIEALVRQANLLGSKKIRIGLR